MKNRKESLAWFAYTTVSKKLGHKVGNSQIKINYDLDIRPDGVKVASEAEVKHCNRIDTMAAIVYILEDLGFFEKGNEDWEPMLRVLIDSTRAAYILGFDKKGQANAEE